MMDELDVSSLHIWYLSEKEALENSRIKINAVAENNERFAPTEEINKKYPPEEWFMEAGHPPVKAWCTIQKMAYEKGLIKETIIGNCKVMFFDVWNVVSIYEAELKRYLMTNCINFYNLKELTLKDFDAIKKLFKEVFMAPPWNDDWSDENQLNEYLLDLMEVRTSLVYGLYVKEVLTGVSIGNIRHWWGGTEYHIEELFIKTSEQGKGLGTKFVDMIEAAIPAKGAKQIFLQTETTVPAYEFYKKRGFDELKTHVSFFKELEK